jgi:hypothetical protein
MAAERFTIDTDGWGDPTINGRRAIEWADVTMVAAMSQLLADLAAQLAANRDCINHFDAAMADLAQLRAECDKLRGLIDGAMDIVEIWQAESPSQKLWKRDWLDGARSAMAGHRA